MDCDIFILSDDNICMITMEACDPLQGTWESHYGLDYHEYYFNRSQYDAYTYVMKLHMRSMCSKCVISHSNKNYLKENMSL